MGVVRFPVTEGDSQRPHARVGRGSSGSLLDGAVQDQLRDQSLLVDTVPRYGQPQSSGAEFPYLVGVILELRNRAVRHCSEVLDEFFVRHGIALSP